MCYLHMALLKVPFPWSGTQDIAIMSSILKISGCTVQYLLQKLRQ